MRCLSALPILCATLLGGCVTPGHYPLSGKVCHPGDPVQQMNACELTALGLLPTTAAPAASDQPNTRCPHHPRHHLPKAAAPGN